MARPEPAAQDSETFVLEIARRFKAPREAVFRAWTDPEAFAQWMGPEGMQSRDVKIDLRPGGRYSLVMHGSEGAVYPLSGTYKEIKAPERLVFTFVWGHGDLEDLEMLVTVTFAEVSGGTLMTLVQERLPRETARQSHKEGWTGSFNRLEKFLAA